MKTYIKENILILLLAIISIISIIIGFILNEDLSTGGAFNDFNLTWKIIIDYTNFGFMDNSEEVTTRHMPLHYLLLTSFYVILKDQYLVRLFYFFFSFLLPIFLYLNLAKIYNVNKLLLIVFSLSFLLIPLFRATAIWPNAHLTATIFFLIGNYFFLKSKENNFFIHKILNLLFLSFAIYSLQTYLILFLYYLYKYFLSEKLYNFIKLFLFGGLLSLPGLFFIMLNPRISELGGMVTRDFFYTISVNFSIIFLFLSFLILNKENLKIIIDKIKIFKKKEIASIFILFCFAFYNQDLFIVKQVWSETSNIKLGGGFFYKLSYFVLNNNLIFISSFLLGLVVSYIIIKYEPKFLEIFIIINLMNLNYVIYQKYFEPLFLIIIIILFKNFLVANVIMNFKNILTFYVLIFLYFVIAYINNLSNFSYQLLS